MERQDVREAEAVGRYQSSLHVQELRSCLTILSVSSGVFRIELVMTVFVTTAGNVIVSFALNIEVFILPELRTKQHSNGSLTGRCAMAGEHG